MGRETRTAAASPPLRARDAARRETGAGVAGRLAGALGRGVLFHVLLGVVALLLPIILLGLLTAVVVRPGPGDRRPALRELPIIVVGMPCVLAALLAPLRAVLQALLFVAERRGATVEPWARSVLVHDGADVFLGACGVVLSLVALARLQSTWAKLKHARNLPTSRARSAAAGLVELQGIARALPDPEASQARVRKTRGPEVEWDTILPAGTILGRDTHFVPGERSRRSSCELTSPFVLEDAAGRILVDPRGASFGGFNTLYQFGAPPARIALSKARLMDGDPVYVLGTVELRDDAPALAADADRLVVTALPAKERAARASGGAPALPLSPFARPRGRVFLLSDAPEAGVRTELARALLDTFVFEVLLFVASLWLVLVHAPGLWR